MCRTKKDVLASDPKPTPPAITTPARRQPSTPSAVRYSATSSTSLPTNQTTASAAASSASSFSSSSSSSISSGAASLTSLRLSISLSDNPTFYPLADISAATNNFLSRHLSSSSSSSSSWRCSLRGKDVVIFQRAFRGNPIALPSRLSALCRSHHSSLVKLLGASIGGERIYLVYEYVAGASLRECLRNPKNPNFTPLSKWISRMQVATDLAEGMDYIHRHCGTIHNLITSSSVIVTEPNFNAKISHFGAADLAGDIPEEEVKIAEEDVAEEEEEGEGDEISAEITPAAVAASPSVLRRSDSRRMRIEGTRGYIAPEVIAGGRISRRSDVFALGVVILELISGREPLKYTTNPETQDYERVSLIETARAAIGTEDEDGASDAEERWGRVRRWVDRRLRDSFPADAAEQLIRVALRCVEEAPFMRPETQWLAAKVSKLFLDSKAWEESVSVPSDFTVSLAPR